MKPLLLILILLGCLLFSGCKTTMPILGGFVTIMAIAGKVIDHGLSRDNLELRQAELELKREKFEFEKELVIDPVVEAIIEGGRG